VVQERVEPYHYASSGLSWPVLGRILNIQEKTLMSDFSLIHACYMSFHIIIPDLKPKNIRRKRRL
jgi:hypothetical protein